jgi:hypothetical protein
MGALVAGLGHKLQATARAISIIITSELQLAV